MRGRSTLRMLGAAGLGAGAMYWLDPIAGRRRRATLGQKTARGAHQLTGGAVRATRDIAHRSEGMLVRTMSRLQSGAAPDEIVVERVRSRLGRACSHPHAIEVSCRDGIVELRGQVPRSELRRVISAVEGVRGVHRLHHALEPSDQPGGVRGDVGMSPAARLVGLAGGLALVLGGARRRRLLGLGALLSGLGILVRSAFDRSWRRAFGRKRPGRAVDVRKTIHVRAPLEEVFALLSAFETFPRFMTHVREVKRLEDGVFRWKVAGPGGAPFTWDAEITHYVPNQVVAWRSRPGSSVKSNGVIRFERTGDGTKVDIRLTYDPPGGLLGHGVARILGVDPRKEMNDDLLRFKSLVELGKATGHQRVTRDEIVKEAERARPLRAV